MDSLNGLLSGSYLSDFDENSVCVIVVVDLSGYLCIFEVIESDMIRLVIEMYSGYMFEVVCCLGIGWLIFYCKVCELGLDK